MTIILFLVDTSASMGQRTYQGMTLLDIARNAIEHFLKQRSRDAAARCDRYMLMSFEEFPKNVKAGWREGQAVFHEQLKSLKPKGNSTLGAALTSAFGFVNVNRAQTGIDNYGCGRVPFFVEPVVIVTITDGASLTCPISGVANEIQVLRAKSIGSELTEEPFRWDHRLFSIVLRLRGLVPVTEPKYLTIVPDNSPIDTMCTATGGRSFCVTSHKMIMPCVDMIVQRIQQLGALVQFQKIGPDPPTIPPPVSERINGTLENGLSRRNGEMEANNNSNSISNSNKSSCDDGWRNLVTMVYMRTSSRQNCAHWPIPEAFWPNNTMTTIPARKAHPVVVFRCEDSEPLICQEFPFDKYELEPSPLTRFILERKQPSVCWQVFVMNSAMPGTSASPFGYLKAATNLQTVNLFIFPYNYPQLFRIVEELLQDNRLATNTLWKAKFEKYLNSIPAYYFQSVKKAVSRMVSQSAQIEVEQLTQSQYSYDLLSYLVKIKHTGREEFESNCTSVTAALQHSMPSTSTSMKNVTKRKPPKGSKRASNSTVNTPPSIPQVQVSNGDQRVMPSIRFRNPFEVQRTQVIDQLGRMRCNLKLYKRQTKVSPLIGGRPGTAIKLLHAEDLHNLPVRQMGDYQGYVKGLEEIGRGPLREIEPQAVRAHAFGNPFKIDKKSIAVDEVGDGNLLSGDGGSTSKSESHRRRSNSASNSSSNNNSPNTNATTASTSSNASTSSTGNNSSSIEAKRARRSKRAPGPLSRNALSQWRRKRREGSVVSLSDLESVSSLSSSDLNPSSSAINNAGTSSSSSSNEVTKSASILLNGDTRDNLMETSNNNNGHNEQQQPPVKRYCSSKNATSAYALDERSLCAKKRNLGIFIRRHSPVTETMRQIRQEAEGLCVSDEQKCSEFAIREAVRFKRNELVENIKSTFNNKQMTSDIIYNNAPI